MSDHRVIKRYANRKLYDTQHSRYVTLEQISQMVREGDDVKIIDNKSQEDLTSVTLAQIIFEEEKKKRSFLSLQTMRNLIQNGGESINAFVHEAKERVTNILPHEEKDADPNSEVKVEDADTYAGRVTPLGEMKEWLDQSKRTVDEWQNKIESNIRNAVGQITPIPGAAKQIAELRERLRDLEAKLGRSANKDEERKS